MKKDGKNDETKKEIKEETQEDVKVDTTLQDRITELEQTVANLNTELEQTAIELNKNNDESAVAKDKLEEQIDGLNTDVVNLTEELQVVTRERNDAIQVQVDDRSRPAPAVENLENVFSTISVSTTDTMTKEVMALPLHNGCLVQSTSVWKETGTVSESLIFVPNTKITEQLDENGHVEVRYLSPLNQV